jgi:hypothetical protein
MPKDVAALIHKLDLAWNARNLEKILTFYSEDFELTSPHIKKRLGIEDGTLRGKARVREWWQRVLEKVPDLSSELIAVAEGVDSVSYIFKSSYTNAIAVSVFFFDAEGKIKKELYHS